MKILTYARKIAHEEGIKPVSSELVEYVIWEMTGYPTFWRTSDALKEFTEQLHRGFRNLASPTRGDR